MNLPDTVYGYIETYLPAALLATTLPKLSPQNGLTSLSESNSEWQAQMSDSSESSSDSDDESGDDGEALGVKSTVGPRFANVSGSEAWYLKRNNIKKN